MRNVLFVLVLSCIGLICGFIVPSGIREIRADLSKSGRSIRNDDSNSRNIIIKTLNISSGNRTSELLTNSIEKHHNCSNNSLDNDLYENSRGKDAAIEERSFIYIKPRAKRPYLKNVYELIPKTNLNNQAINSFVLSQSILDDISRNFLNEHIENKVSDTHLGQSQHNKYQSTINNFINYYIDEERKKQIERITNKQGKYFEIIKAPIVRPVIKTNENDFISMEKSLFNFTIGRRLLSDIQESLSSRSAIKLKNDGQVDNKSTKTINYETGVTVGDETVVEDNFDQTVKRVIENQISERKPNNVDNKGLHWCDCLKKGKKPTLNNIFELESICKCGRKHFIKLIGDDIVN